MDDVPYISLLLKNNWKLGREEMAEVFVSRGVMFVTDRTRRLVHFTKEELAMIPTNDELAQAKRKRQEGTGHGSQTNGTSIRAGGVWDPNNP